MVKMLGFGTAMDLISTQLNPDDLFTATQLSDFESVDSIRDTILKELDGRMKIELSLPQKIFKNIFGKELFIGEVRKWPEFKNLKEAKAWQSKGLVALCSHKGKKYLFETMPILLRQDLQKLFPGGAISFDIKSDESIEDKLKEKRAEKNLGPDDPVGLGDLIRCTVIVPDIYGIWSGLTAKLLGNLKKLNFKGVKVKMQNVDQESKEVQVRDTFVFDPQWPGLMLHLFYHISIVEVQIMSPSIMLSYAKRLSHDNREWIKQSGV